MTQRSYKYFREEFPPLPVKLDHMELYINFLDSYVEVENILDVSAVKDLKKIELDARDLEIVDVSWNQAPPSSGNSHVTYEYLRESNKLVVMLDRPIRTAERFKLRTLTRCIPSENLLEGIYKDVTPFGAPQQYMSQCQQWGFQRIAPVFDDCRAKCRMLTTIEADARYTSLISNGDIDLTSNPDKEPRLKRGNPHRKVITYRNDIPMAPYLFIVCVGTWDTLVDYVTYDSGKTVRLEYLVPPGRTEGAVVPMAILKESVLWVKATQGYEYASDVYRTICMTKSNFGGMENVGNTTIVTDAALVDEHTTDMSLLYAYAVIVHEFEHNQCGSETTMETPFDVWLNEAYTVDVERGFVQDMFDRTFVRLNQVDSIRSPLLGPLAIEDTGTAGKIVREGFNDPDELIDSVTYVKAAEVIRMLRLLIGENNFQTGKELYFSRYKDSNANTEQFFQCFEEVSGRSLDQFMKCWLYRIGYPKVLVNSHFDSKNMRNTIHFSQQQDDAGKSPFHMPIQIALIDHQGKVTPGTDTVFDFSTPTAEIIFDNLETEPAFASINRNYSFYGTCRLKNENIQTMILQTRLDDNLFNRVEAFRRLTDLQRVRLLNDLSADIDTDWIDLYGELLLDPALPSSTRAFFLRIDEQPLDREYSSWHIELVQAREILVRTINKAFRPQLFKLFHSLDTYGQKSSPKDGIEDRILKQTLLEMICLDDPFDSHDLIREHYQRANTATDRIGALIALNRSSMKERFDILERTYQAWSGHISAYANYLRIISSGRRDDVFDMIEKERSRPSFDITNPTWSRALFLTMAGNTNKIWTAEGVNWATRTIVELAPINTYVASKLVNVFQSFRRMRPNLKPLVHRALNTIVEEVDDSVSPTVNRQAASYLE